MAVWYWIVGLAMLYFMSQVFTVGVVLVEKVQTTTNTLNATADAAKIVNSVLPSIGWALVVLAIGVIFVVIISSEIREYDTAYGGYKED